MKIVWIALANLRRLFRVRATLFFLFVFPMLLILVLGATFGGSSNPRLGVVSTGSGDLGSSLVAELRSTPHLRLVNVRDTRALSTQVQRGNLAAGLVIPAGLDTAVRAGGDVALRYLARPEKASQQLSETVRGAVAREAAVVGAARFAFAEKAVTGFDEGLVIAARTAPAVPAVSVEATTAGAAKLSQSLGQFDESAWTELLLFLFLVALTGAAALIETRRLGLSERILSTPTTAWTVIAGETLGRVMIGAIQAAVIIVGSAVLFGVRWGQPAGVVAVVLLFDLVGAGAGILLGTMFRNEQQAMGVSLLAGMGLAALGGCMVPLEVFSRSMKTLAHLTPHAWANDAFAKLVAHHASITALTRQLGVLAGFAALLLAVATWRLRQVLTA